ncbi:MAG TPA: YihY/virulence factor BrkB family protein [Mesorhizobium sp.]|jgi:membrane protein|nr:YihY/virulence factor BrkB family protein [Mesorhizobium sp.]
MASLDQGADGVHARGRLAERPSEFPAKGWKDILWRVYAEATEDRLMLLAAGATFYLLLALFPFLTAFVSLYGFVADPVTVADHIAFLGSFMPGGGVELIGSQLKALATQNPSSLSLGFIFGLALALWSANNGVKALIEGLNAAYDEDEKRSFIKLNLVSFAFTIGAILTGIFFLISVGVVPAMLALFHLGSVAEVLISIGRWPVMLIAVIAGISLLYRYGPSRARPQWRWVTWGAVFAAVVWIVASIAFSWYLQNFADYNATYGALGAVIGFMVWVWISCTILFVGAELNAEMEHQTARDTTTGKAQPMGARGAKMADELGKAADGSETPEQRDEAAYQAAAAAGTTMRPHESMTNWLKRLFTRREPQPGGRRAP